MGQIGFVIDLNKCMGCQTCVVACKVGWANAKGMDHEWWMTVTTQPGRGYPRDWEAMGGGLGADGAVLAGRVPTTEDYGGVMEFNHDEVFYGADPGAVLAPATTPTWGPNWEEDVGGGAWPNAWMFYLPRTCNHCSRPACTVACPAGAITKRDDGVVEVADPRACAACEATPCMAACPYKVIFRNTVEGHAEKCHGCTSRLDVGVAPMCVRMCPGRCIWIGDVEDGASAVHRLVHEWQVALPLHPEYGCEPNVYYVPPISPPRLDPDGAPDCDGPPRVPTEYLRRLFGPGVDAALGTLHAETAKRRRRPKEPSELVDVLVAKRTTELLGPYTVDPVETALEAR